jgi:SAM-dependent methyltransferase
MQNAMWLPAFACPECRESLAASETANAYVCVRCSTTFDCVDGVHRFLSRQRAEAAAPFLRQYRIVRGHEGYRAATREYYVQLPSVASDDRHATEWRIRRESLVHLQRFALPDVSKAPLRVLDLGAGCGWLSHRLAAGGHRVVAVDRLDDDADGLGACRHYPVRFVMVQADFDALPFAPGQFGLVVFDGSLHYAADPAVTLAQATRMLTRGGSIAVMDSPMFERDGDGQAMVSAQLRRLGSDHGLREVVRPGLGFLTFAALDRAGEQLGLRGRFIPSRGPLAWRLGRQLARLRLRRAPAAFGVWVAQ